MPVPHKGSVGPLGLRPTLNDLISRLLVLQAQGGGTLPVLIETRSRFGEIIYAQAHAKRDVLEHMDGRYRQCGSDFGAQLEVIRVG